MSILVAFKDYADGKTHHIEGIFPLCNPWWSATLFVSGGQKKRLAGYRSFKLRDDEFVSKERVVWLFVMECLKNDKKECTGLYKEASDAFHKTLR